MQHIKKNIRNAQLAAQQRKFQHREDRSYRELTKKNNF